MVVHTDIKNLPLFKNAVVTIGTFDGVHTGHLQIIHQLTKEAININGESVIITFHPHTIIIGYDHHFGKNRRGNYKLLEFYQSECNFKVKEIPEHVLHNVIISSTRIRHALEEGDINTANEYLGYSYFFEGRVIEGDKLGRTLGYPTANILITDKNKLVPGNGVYAVEVSINEPAESKEIEHHSPDISHRTSQIVHLTGMMNIGIRPTVGGTKKVIEVNIFNFNESIYDQTIRIYVRYFLRSEIKFNSLEALKEQLLADKTTALKLLKST